MNDLCVVFDIDDTLYFERDYCYSGFDALAPWAKTWLGASGFAEKCREAHDSGRRGNVFNLVLEACGVECRPEAISALVGLYRSHLPAIRLCDDAREALSEAAARWPVAVISDGSAMSQSRKADALGLHSYASPIFLTELFGRDCTKPSPVLFRKVQEARPARRYVYVADNPAKDFHAPRMLGWHSVRIRRPGGLHHAVPNLPEATPNAELPDCSGLIRLLSELL
jgi:putative hydrolase of the HAD superfamily